MTRLRQVLTVTAIVLLLVMQLPRSKGVNMSLPIGDVLAKLASGEKLSQGEIEVIRLQMNNVQRTVDKFSGWIGADGSLNVPSLRADQTEFEVMPGGLFMVSIYGSSQSIPNSIVTTVQFDTVDVASPYFVWDATNHKIIHKISTSGHVILITGAIIFDPNVTGRREARIISYYDTGALSYSSTLICIEPRTDFWATLPFAYTYFLDTNAHDLKFAVVQTSGGALNLYFARLALWVIK